MWSTQRRKSRQACKCCSQSYFICFVSPGSSSAALRGLLFVGVGRGYEVSAFFNTLCFQGFEQTSTYPAPSPLHLLKRGPKVGCSTKHLTVCADHSSHRATLMSRLEHVRGRVWVSSDAVFPSGNIHHHSWVQQSLTVFLRETSMAH